MVKERFKAKFILGNEEKEVSGWDAFDIINKILSVNEVCDIVKAKGNVQDVITAKRLHDWNYVDFDNPGDMHRFDRFNFVFSFGRYTCLEWKAIE